MNNCPKCNASLVHVDEDKRSITPAIYGGKTITRVVGTRYRFDCGALIFKNEHYPSGSFEIDCQSKR